VEVKPDIYQITLKHPGYQTARFEVTVGNKVEVLQVELVKTP
jgi:hypothetical protein